jgi:uncharacterized protein (DUF1697 family)
VSAFVALLRAVNVGGTGKLPMSTLKSIGEAAGLAKVATYIASGNMVFTSDADERAVKTALESGLEAYAGTRIGVLVRTLTEIDLVVAGNPFPGEPGNRTLALFTDDMLSEAAIDRATGRDTEEIRLGHRAIYIHYPDGIARSRLRIPADRTGTARNMNTVATLARMAGSL